MLYVNDPIYLRLPTLTNNPFLSKKMIALVYYDSIYPTIITQIKFESRFSLVYKISRSNTMTKKYYKYGQYLHTILALYLRFIRLL